MTYYYDERFLIKLDNDIKTIFEIGSRYGEDTKKLSEHFPNSNIFAFECNPNTVEICKIALKDYKNIHFFGKGIGSKNETLPFYSYIENNDGASSFYKRIDADETQKMTGQIPITTISNIMDEFKINQIDLLCMDIQGFEINALKGAGNNIRNIKYIIMEEPKPKINLNFLPTDVYSKYINAPTPGEIKKFMKDNNFIEIERIQENQIEDNVMYKNLSFLKNFTLVTGADSKYFCQLKGLLYNIHDIKQSIKHYKLNIIVYDLGLTHEQLNELKEDFKNVIFEKFNFENYPEHVSLKKYNGDNCSYAWKPIIIHEVCEKYKGLVHWMDTRTVYTNLENLLNVLEKNYLYTPQSADTIERWTFQTTIELMNGSKYNNSRCRSGGIFGVNYDIDWCRDFVKDWKTYALIKEYICPQGSNRFNHRQDQSILSILYYKYKEKHRFDDVTEFIDLQTHKRILNKTFLVCSYGGCGSKMVCKALEKFGKVYHIHSRKPPEKLEYSAGAPEVNGQIDIARHNREINDKNTYFEWFSGIEMSDKERKNCYVIYLYRNPIETIFSRFIYNYVGLDNVTNCESHLQHIQIDKKTTIKEVITQNKDLYGLIEFYNNYTKFNQNRNYKVYAVKFEEIFEKQHELSRSLEIGNLNLLEKEPTVKMDSNKLELVEKLNIIYKDLLEEMNNNDFLRII
jgi:FkbM family methyltransferase